MPRLQLLTALAHAAAWARQQPLAPHYARQQYGVIGLAVAAAAAAATGGMLLTTRGREAEQAHRRMPWPRALAEPPQPAGTSWRHQSGPFSQVQSEEPLSGAIPALDEAGRTNHPLDYDPITNEHTAAMTLAKAAAMEAYEAGRYGEAERRFKEVLAEARLGFPASDPHIPSALHYLAEFYRNTRRYDAAAALYAEALEHLRDHLGEKHWMYATALCSLAALHEARGQYEEAISLLRKALELRRVLFSAGSFMYADSAALLAAALLKAHAAAAGPAGASSSSSSSSSSGSSRSNSSGAGPAPAGPAGSAGGWLARLRGGTQQPLVAGDAAVAEAVTLLQTAVRVVEDSGSVENTPVVPWLLECAAAQRLLGRHAAAVASLRQALAYMAAPPSGESSGGRTHAIAAPNGEAPAAAVLSGPGSGSSSTEQAALPAQQPDSADDMRRRLAAEASEVSERLVDAQLAAGDLPGARATLRAALEARMHLFGRHLVVAKTMTRLANLLMAAPADPEAPELAPHFAASAVAIAEHALQSPQRTSMWSGLLHGAAHKAKLEAQRSSDRLLAALQLGNASLALAAAERSASRLPEAEASLRQAVGQLRWVLQTAGQDLQQLSSQREKAAVEPALLERLAGLLVDLKLLQMDCLEALAEAINVSAAAPQQPGPSEGDQPEAEEESEERLLLLESELLAAELYAD